MDAMSTVLGISSSGKTNQGSSGKPDDDARFPGRRVHGEQGLSELLHAKKGPERRRGRRCHV